MTGFTGSPACASRAATSAWVGCQCVAACSNSSATPSTARVLRSPAWCRRWLRAAGSNVGMKLQGGR
ncbi:hypothetical protein H0I39_10795 [Ottowia beijingensis]|uniref:Uncharacterized protein n=1 Tax=Ottowia beijingensis TaxID=1207057 RepID=A0A853INU4_9BURK|nr:hypothetical protein [Ottowia beijingensis]NZA02116.1 hypothetical protein [Ottowia beijingensis]